MNYSETSKQLFQEKELFDKQYLHLGYYTFIAPEDMNIWSTLVIQYVFNRQKIPLYFLENKEVDLFVLTPKDFKSQKISSLITRKKVRDFYPSNKDY